MKNIFYTCLIIIITLFFIFTKKINIDENFTNQQVDFYEEIWIDKNEIKKKLLKTKNYIKKNNLKLLNIGSGTGNYLKVLEQIYPNFSFYAIDIDENMIEKTKVNIPTADIKHDNVLKRNNYEPETFDVICLFNETLHQIPYDHWEKLFGNINYWLKIDGVLIIDIFDSNNLDPSPADYSYIKPGKDGEIVSRTFYPDKFHSSQFVKVIGGDKYEYDFEENVRKPGKKYYSFDTKLYIPPIKESLKKLHDNGFELKKIDDLEGFKTYYYEKYRNSEFIYNKK